jgi:hypothetical protein
MASLPGSRVLSTFAIYRGNQRRFLRALTGQVKRLGFRADILERTCTTAKVFLEAPDLTEGISVLSTAESTSLSVLSGDPAGFRHGHIAARTVMFFL